MDEPVTAKPGEARPARSAAAQIADLLAEEGYRPHLEAPEGGFQCIDFKAEGLRYQARVGEDDPDFVCIALGYLLEEPVPEDAVLHRAGLEVQSALPVVKFFLDPDRKFFEMQAELFLGGQGLRPPQLERCIHVLRRAAGEVQERLRTAAPKARA